MSASDPAQGSVSNGVANLNLHPINCKATVLAGLHGVSPPGTARSGRRWRSEPFLIGVAGTHLPDASSKYRLVRLMLAAKAR